MRSTCHLFSDGSQSPQGPIFRFLLQTCCVLLCSAGLPTPLPAQEHTGSQPLATAAGISSNSPIRQIGPGLFAIGEIRLNQSNRTVTVPATVNLRAGALEYLLVTDSGKIHESLLRTSVAPYHLQLALLLVGLAPASTAPNPPAEPAKSAKPRSGDPASIALSPSSELTIDVTWTIKARTRTYPVGRFVQDRRARKAIGAGRWIFTGSRFRDDGFAAQTDGSLITLIDDVDAIVGSRLPGADDDDNWLALGQKLPPMDSPVNLILRPRAPASRR